jgi:hypothetical protein
MRGEAPQIASTFATPCAVSSKACSRIGFVSACFASSSQELIHVVNVPRPFDLRHHDHVESIAEPHDQIRHILQMPRRVQRIDAAPIADILAQQHFAHLHRARARRILGVGGDGVFQIGQQHIDLARHVRRLGAHLLQMRRYEMDHPLQRDGQLPQRRRRARGQGGEEVTGRLHQWFGPVMFAHAAWPSGPVVRKAPRGPGAMG